MKDLKQKTIRSGAAKLCGQAAGFVIRITSLAIMARLLDPQDYGLVAMVTAITGLYGLFSSAGLSEVTIQRPNITNEQISTLFWINILVGTSLALLCLLTAPLLVRFYHEPRLFWVTVTIATGFIINAAAVQHSALLQRQMRYASLTAIEILSQLVGLVAGIGMALADFGYWALVAATTASLTVYMVCVWVVSRWIPGLPRHDNEIGYMLRFGGTVTLNSLVVYVAYNFEKVLLGRFWGPDALGLYGRAYQLINFPTENLHTALGGVAFSALSRLQDEPHRLRGYYLKGYALINSLTLPITVFAAVFADDIILVVLGPKWVEAAPIFRLLSPTILIFGIINPLAWLLISTGLQGRSLRVALVIAPLVIVAYLVGLPFGPNGVALAYSAAMTVWLVPHIFWCLHGTVISPWDLFSAISRPLFSAVLAAAIAFGVQRYLSDWSPPLLRLALTGGAMVIVYFVTLLFALGQSRVYLDLLAGLRKSSTPDSAET